MRWLWIVLLVLLVVPRYAGVERLALIAPRPAVEARRYVPEGGWPRRIGALTPIGGLTLHSNDPAFGGFSAMAIRGNQMTLLSDGGNAIEFALRNGQVNDARGQVLRDGPGYAWHRSDRDTESLAVDPRSGTAWVGYEGHNQIWRYPPGFARTRGAERVTPKQMRKWSTNSGAESLVRLANGRFIVIAEGRTRDGTRPGLLFSGDPLAEATRTRRFKFRAPKGFSPSDAVQLPQGDLLVLTRRFRLPFNFDAALVRVPLGDLKGGKVVEGAVIARLAAPVVGENCEALGVSVENGRTMLWIATDNDLMPGRPNYLLKFRLDG